MFKELIICKGWSSFILGMPVRTLVSFVKLLHNISFQLWYSAFIFTTVVSPIIFSESLYLTLNYSFSYLAFIPLKECCGLSFLSFCVLMIPFQVGSAQCYERFTWWLFYRLVTLGALPRTPSVYSFFWNGLLPIHAWVKLLLILTEGVWIKTREVNVLQTERSSGSS